MTVATNSEGLLSYAGAGGYLSRFGIRVLGDVVGGVANSAIGATSHHFQRFNKRTFYDGLEFTAGGVFEGRLVAGFGWRPFNLSLEGALEKYWVSVGDDEAVVFRVRSPLSSDVGGLTSPLGRLTRLDLYHEALVAISADRFAITEAGALETDPSGGLIVRQYAFEDDEKLIDLVAASLKTLGVPWSRRRGRHF